MSLLRGFTFILVISVISCVAQVRSYMMSDVKQLLEDKLTDYNRDIRPMLNQTEDLILDIHMEVAAIVEFDEVNQKIIITAPMILQWSDESLVWNPADYGGVDELIVKSRHFWTPSVILTNTFTAMTPIGGGADIDLVIKSNGGVTLNSPDVFSATCDPDVTYFPWDKHTCTLLFLHTNPYTNHVILRTNSTKAGTAYYAPHRAWDLEDTEVKISAGGAHYEVSLHLRRRPLFVIVNLIAPVILLSFLNVLTFLTPTETGERLSYSITILLAIAVFLTIVGDDLPKISSPMSVFSYYLLAVLSLSCFIIFATFYSLNLYHMDENKEVTGLWKSIAILLKRRYSVKVEPDSSEPPDLAENKLADVDTEKKVTKGPFDFNSATEAPNITWKELSKLVDRVCFVVCLAVLLLGSTMFFSLLNAAAF
ncbi:hypothetical protein ACF0H5_001933 [Mactra antiquata]